MDLSHHLHEELGNSLCCVLRWQHAKVNPFRELIYYYEDVGVSLVRQQSYNEIH